MQITKQSKLGTAAFVLAMIPTVILIVSLLLHSVGLTISVDINGMVNGALGFEDNIDIWEMVLMYSIFILIPLIGFALGIASLFQKNIKNTLGKLSLIICGIYVLPVILMAITQLIF